MTRRTANVELVSEDVLMINPADAKRNELVDGDMVELQSARGKVRVKAVVTDEVREGVLSSTFHFPEIMMNTITSDVHDSEALCPEYKVVAVSLNKVCDEQTV